MTESEFLNGAAQFFSKHSIGQEMKRRWTNRVAQLTNQLIYETDEQKKILLQAKIQYHREVIKEIGI